jgi:acyl-CoA thioesterase
MISIHPFDVATGLDAGENGSFKGCTSPQYANMVGPFGGITSATLLKAAWLHPARIGEPVSVTVNFAAPIIDGEFSVIAKPVRTNRSTQHWIIELMQNDQVAATATAVFEVRRETWSFIEAAYPAVPPAKDVQKALLPTAVAWIQNYDMRFIKGALSLNETDKADHDSETMLWIRDEPGRPMDFFSLTAICDAFFPRIFVRRRRRTPIGTVSLTVIFHADSEMLLRQGEKEVLGAARALQFRNGFFDQNAEIWSPGGELLASTSQVVYFKE